jgi:hypothetical protein
MTIVSYILLGLCFSAIVILIVLVMQFRSRKTPLKQLHITPLGIFALAEDDFKETHHDGNDNIVDYIYDSLETYMKDNDLMMFYNKREGMLLFYKVAYKYGSYSGKDGNQ